MFVGPRDGSSRRGAIAREVRWLHSRHRSEVCSTMCSKTCLEIEKERGDVTSVGLLTLLFAKSTVPWANVRYGS